MNKTLRLIHGLHVACSARHAVLRCTKSWHLTLFYALTTVICVPIKLSCSACAEASADTVVTLFAVVSCFLKGIGNSSVSGSLTLVSPGQYFQFGQGHRRATRIRQKVCTMTGKKHAIPSLYPMTFASY